MSRLRSWRWAIALSAVAWCGVVAPETQGQAPSPQGPPAAPPAAGRGRGAAAANPWAGKKHLLFVTDAQSGLQDDSLSHAMAVVERLGRESGIFNTMIRTEFQLVTKTPFPPAGPPRPGGTEPDGPRNTRVLPYYDAVFFAGRDEALTDDEKAGLVSFVREDGKGLVVSHAAGAGPRQTSTEFAALVGSASGGEYPLAARDVIVEDPAFPGADAFPARFTFSDRFTVVGPPYARNNVRVIMRLDAAKLDRASALTKLRPDGDFPIVYATLSGKGRVFVSNFSLSEATWDNPRVQKLYLEGIKWALGVTNPDITPRPMPASK